MTNEEMKKAMREYNKERYHSNPKRVFMTTIRSHQKILEHLGFTVIPPDASTLDSAVDYYLEHREKRPRKYE